MAVEVPLSRRLHDTGGAHDEPGARCTCVRTLDGDHRCVVVRIEGELDALVQPQFRRALDDAVRAAADAVVIDLRATLFLSLRAAAALGDVQAPAARRGVDVRLVTARPEVERSLELTGVRGRFHRYSSLRAAMTV
ncbi:MAG TPA: STAS domain-containing protein [Nocardia sp.]|uniref:STAS domain-containing protein n=1 Tax=Nocardia TaxID=1817 RepID=UPI002457F103|nr:MULTISPECIES: STAS domain-containing protein [Nocardia]HLS79432.1 STAS domain-containing protein [Nocardia sp.]